MDLQEEEPAISAQEVRSQPEMETAPPPAAVPQPRTQRLDSLDAFRGLTIFTMLLVNNIALNHRTPPELMHAPWNQGVHIADLVFPWFLLIVGVAIPYSWASHWRKGWRRGKFLGRAFVRTLALVGLGCLIDSSIAHRPLFDLDVLQLIGLAYFVAAFFTMLLPTPLRVFLAFVFLLLHSYVILHLHVPGMPTGTFLPNRNVIAYFNSHDLERYHLTGLISVVPASALVMLGTFFGDTLRRERFTPEKRLGRVLVAGAVLVALGMLWNRVLPYNKPVWTGSYILFCGGLGAIVLGLMYAVLDVSAPLRRWRGWAMPLRVFGSNAIVAYVLPILVKLYVLNVYRWPHTHLVIRMALLHKAILHWGPVGGGWAYTLGYIVFWWLVLLILYRRRWFVRV